MAKIEGTQSIPSEWKELYDGTLTPLMPNAVIRGRYPWKMPAMQEDGYKVSGDQKKQRDRWKAIRDKFKVLPQADRERWYDAAPIWHSLLWYYNYFMMSGLMGNAVVGGQGGGVIKDINHYAFTFTAGTAPEETIAIDTCDPKKTVVFFYGAGIFQPWGDAAPSIYPYLKSLNSTQLIAAMSMQIDFNARCSVSVIEYI